MKKYITKITVIYMLLAIYGLSAVIASEGAAVNEQLVINSAMLSSGSDEMIKAVAAKQLLIDNDQAAMNVLVEVLGDKENVKAIEAVCKAISESGQWDTKIRFPQSYIKPLISVLKDSTPELANQAAVALAVYPYDDIKLEIKEILNNDDSSQQARMNAVYAVGLRLSEKAAIHVIISLLEDKDPVIAGQAGKTLQGWVPMGTNKDLWNNVRDELKQKSPDEIVRDRLESQELRVQTLNQERNTLISELVNVYEQLYQTKAEPAAKSLFLAEALKKEVVEIRRWAVEKVTLWRNASDLPTELTVAVVEVISDNDSGVRLEAAKLMVYMADADPTAKLLAQLKIEDVAAVQTALLEALAESCYYALLPSSGLKLDPVTRIYVLDKASEFLAGNEPNRAIIGAEVVRKLLEKNGLEDAVAQKYIINVENRYKKMLKNDDAVLASRMLDVINRFCLSDFHYRAITIKTFEVELVNALSSAQATVRKAAIQGLINIDKAVALQTLVEKQIYNDPDASIVDMVINLAKEVGGEKDYIWLTEKVKLNIDGAWEAIVAVLQREDVSVVEKAVMTIDTLDIDDAKKIEVFEIGRKKAGLQYRSTVILARFYIQHSKTKEAAELYLWLLADEAGKSEAVNDAQNALNVFVATNNNDAVINLVTLLLATGDIDPAGEIATRLQVAVKSDKASLKDKLTKIVAPEARPGWQTIIDGWKSVAQPAAVQAKPQSSAEKAEKSKPIAKVAIEPVAQATDKPAAIAKVPAPQNASTQNVDVPK